ncbi:type VI secretion system baseplate subunit TssE [Methylomicrobium lacus]|uniref:type VI secretion system baseplate subunit TssE n=1 Tax=Methylomicrobium lacus TaxID=136992 RepID=UPI0035A9AD1E
MAELTHQERLQPSLLDRLTDDTPDKSIESREQRILSIRQLRQSVLRDLAWLLSASSLDTMVDLAAYPFVEHSVINYGTPLSSGTSVSSMDTVKIERKIKQAILDFEPRILAHSLTVKLVSDEGKMNQQAVFFTIEGELWAQPLPTHLFIRSSFDLETGEVTVKDLGG